MDAILTLLLQMQLQRHLAPKAIDAATLAPVVYALSKKHDVDPELVVKILIVESKGVAHAYNARTKDTGLMQVNERTARLYNFSPTCLRNWKCNLESGIIVLSDLQEFKKYRHCTYNTGPKWHNKKKACFNYEAKLASIQ